MLRTFRIALVVAVMAVTAVTTASSASALGFYAGGDYLLFGFDSP